MGNKAISELEKKWLKRWRDMQVVKPKSDVLKLSF